MKDHWRQHPPLHVSMMIVGAALGVDWDKVRSAMTGDTAGGQRLPAPAFGPSIAELAAQLPPPRSHEATLAASAAAIRALNPSPPQVH